ncbi:hypothetical protein QR680_011818 [Steinernema hermaphroditum]|uniref:C-type lectin domain-containing protein n=1 Tax=Steinernema hermaphroditum TaxID=289476 RepID=A0AA39HZV1_9BILA|nr:hypothetical protein QR680_011818 [Steinernema hermaphroditum]
MESKGTVLLLFLITSFFAGFTPSSANLYVRQIPNNLIVSSNASKELFNVTSYKDCAMSWGEEDLIAFNYNSTSKECFGYKFILKMKKGSGSETSYLLTSSSEDKCQGDVMADLENRLECMSPFTMIRTKHSVACYYMMKKEEYTQYEDINQWDYVAACRRSYSYSHAASILSQEENDLIMKSFKPEMIDELRGLKIGLRTHITVEWNDGSVYNFSLLVPTSQENMKFCYGKTCYHAMLYWNNKGEAFWRAADIDQRELLCKYTMLDKL